MITTDIQPVLHQISDAYIRILNKNLVGVYIHGSIAFNCFNWDKSDIDFIAVVDEPLSLETKRQLMDATIAINPNAPKKGLEMSVVLKKHCVAFIYPTPYELHFSSGHIDWYQADPSGYFEKMNGVDPDLAAHFTIIKHRGILLCGDEINNVFSSVDGKYYLDSIQADIKGAREDILDNPVYIILNLCRVLAYTRESLILSKREGGIWALGQLPRKHHASVHSALESYASNKAMQLDIDSAISFCNDILPQIFQNGSTLP